MPMMIKKMAAMLQRRNPRGLDVNCSCTTFVKGNADAHNNTVQKLNRKTLCFACTITPSFYCLYYTTKHGEVQEDCKIFFTVVRYSLCDGMEPLFVEHLHFNFRRNVEVVTGT